jgi:hypothetical protein
LNNNYEGLDLINLSEFVNRFATNLTCVSHEEFLANFNNVLDDTIAHLDRNRTIILTMEDQTNKSSVWLSLLAWGKLRNIVTFVMPFHDLNVYIKQHPIESISILYIDDAVYSGDQCTSNIIFNILGRSKEIRNNVEILFVIPYISYFARNIVDKNIFMLKKWFSNRSVSFDKLYTETEFELLTISSKHFQYWTNYFGGPSIHGVIPNVFAMYFDHKLPDKVSVYTQIIAYSPLIPENGYNFNDIQLGNGFIIGCYRYHNEKRPSILHEGNSADKEQPLCPQPVYKLLSYRFDGKHVNHYDDLLQWLKVNNHMCGNCGIQAKFFSGDITFCGKSCQASWYKYKANHLQ